MKNVHDNSEMIGLSHVGLYARNPAALAEFYRDVMGMQLVGAAMRVTHSVPLPS